MAAWWLTRRYGLDARELFFVNGAMCWYELLLIGAPVAVTVPLLAPPLVAFYVASYAVYCGAFGLLVARPERLWSPDLRRVSFRRKVIYGMLAGGASWAVYVVWAAMLGVV